MQSCWPFIGMILAASSVQCAAVGFAAPFLLDILLMTTHDISGQQDDQITVPRYVAKSVFAIGFTGRRSFPRINPSFEFECSYVLHICSDHLRDRVRSKISILILSLKGAVRVTNMCDDT